MASRNFAATPQAIRKLLAQGRGQGTGSQYLPWLTVRDVSSRGQANRVFGHTTQRLHHFLSRLELRVFLAMDLAPPIFDIREQFPCLPVEETWAIAQACGVAHPIHPRTRYPVVVTTDFLLTTRTATTEHLHARTVKYAKELEKRRTLEKLEIERQYWRNRQIEWGIMTEQELPPALARHLEWVHPLYKREALPPLVPHTLHHATEVLTHFVTTQGVALGTALASCDRDLHLPKGTSLALTRHLLATQQWMVDLTNPISLSHPLVLRQPLPHPMVEAQP